MKRLCAFLFVIAGPAAIWLGASGFTINGAVPGAAASMTPYSVGTSTPVAVIPCASTLSTATNPVTLYWNVCVTGGSSGTDSCYLAPAASASPCAAASPAPNAGTKAGWPFPTGGAGWSCSPLNYPGAGGGTILNSEWDAVCSAASMKVGVVTLP